MPELGQSGFARHNASFVTGPWASTWVKNGRSIGPATWQTRSTGRHSIQQVFAHQQLCIVYVQSLPPVRPRREMSFLTEVDVYPLPDFGVRKPSLFS
jgi:hypothetical protein